MIGIVSLEQNGKKNAGIVLSSTTIPGQEKLSASGAYAGPETIVECLFSAGIPRPASGAGLIFQTENQLRNATVIQAEITVSNRDFIRMILHLN